MLYISITAFTIPYENFWVSKNSGNYKVPDVFDSLPAMQS